MNDSGGHLRGVAGIFVAGVEIFRPWRGDPRASLHLVSGLTDGPSESRSVLCGRKDAERNGAAFFGSTNDHVRR